MSSFGEVSVSFDLRILTKANKGKDSILEF